MPPWIPKSVKDPTMLDKWEGHDKELYADVYFQLVVQSLDEAIEEIMLFVQ